MFSLDLLLQISTKHDLFSLSMFLLHFSLNWFIFVLKLHIIRIHQITQMMIQCFFPISWTHPVWFSPMKFSYCTEFKLRSTIWWISQDHNVLIIFFRFCTKIEKNKLLIILRVLFRTLINQMVLHFCFRCSGNQLQNSFTEKQPNCTINNPGLFEIVFQMFIFVTVFNLNRELCLMCRSFQINVIEE